MTFKKTQIVGDSLNKPLRVDENTGAISIQKEQHSLAHDGRTYFTSLYTSSVANNGIMSVMINVPTGTSVHPDITASVQGDALIYLLEDATTTAAWVTMTTLNLNMDSANSNTSEFTYEITTTSAGTGTAYGPIYVPGGVGGLTEGVFGADIPEPVLSGPNKYIIRLINEGGVAKKMNLYFTFYEV